VRVVGIDPGTARTGFAVIEETPVGFETVELGVIKTSASTDATVRLLELHDAVTGLLERSRPDAVALERVYFQVNARSAIQVGQASGVILLAAARRGVPCFGYSPNEVKMAICGYGGADKEQVMRMTKKLLRGSRGRIEPDAADAAAVAVAHLNSYKVKKALGGTS
jgi:crossover junction endodeoxyribonuclease RuvC